MMKKLVSVIFMLFLLFAYPACSMAQGDEEIKFRVNDLVLKHYMDGIPYAKANALGKDALPYLFELLENPDEKLFWTNIIVTIGFIEDTSAVDALINFLEKAEGEVDGATFRALLSVPYALGCIASGGHAKAIDYLGTRITGQKNLRINWNYKNKPISDLIAEQSVMGLAVSGRPEARQKLQALKTEAEKKGVQETRRLHTDTLPQGLLLMDNIKTRGRAAVLNPRRDE
ncbi:MAG: hypothetical protein WC836_19955 [Desulfobacula sp.]|jgi:hypothetical protein